LSDFPSESGPVTVRGGCVAVGARGLLITGAPGAGKSSIALHLMAFGAALVSDDATCLSRPDEGAPMARAPEAIAGRIEARGIGILAAATPAPSVRLAAILDLDVVETERLPPERRRSLLGFSLPLLHKVESPHFAAGLLQYLKSIRP
jgi:HPr kinase/phosphorylase